MHLILTEQNICVGRYKNLFKITSNNKILKTIPANKLTHIIIFVQGFSISAEALQLSAENKITLTICKPYGKPISIIQSPDIHPYIQVRWNQYKALQNGFGIEIVKKYIHSKIENQFQLLFRYKNYLPQIEPTYHQNIQPLIQKLKQISPSNIPNAQQKIMNIEAYASSLYWNFFKQLIPPQYNFTHRTHRHSKDPVNSALNYGYGILYSECYRALSTAGLDPYAGFLHAIQNNKQSLVFDFIEQFRQPLVDTPLLASLRQGLNISIQKNGLLEKETQKRLTTLYIERLYENTSKDTNNTYQKIIFQEALKLAQYLNSSKQTHDHQQ